MSKPSPGSWFLASCFDLVCWTWCNTGQQMQAWGWSRMAMLHADKSAGGRGIICPGNSPRKRWKQGAGCICKHLMFPKFFTAPHLVLQYPQVADYQYIHSVSFLSFKKLGKEPRHSDCGCSHFPLSHRQSHMYHAFPTAKERKVNLAWQVNSMICSSGLDKWLQAWKTSRQLIL